MKNKTIFSKKLLAWFDQHGRKHLPWQKNISPYRVWLSEVMLQQTQVETVIPYFQSFTRTYPRVKDLATANLDEVLHLWTGLGYYARARNLHKCAVIVHQELAGRFPRSVESLMALPGIGRSTAGAIASIAYGQSAPILDGNVKRVLTRIHAVAGWPGHKEVEKSLWAYAHDYTPRKRCAEYTQAIMDLGATLCRRSSPSCLQCPFKQDCEAFKQERVSEFPGKKPKKPMPVKSVQLLLIRNAKRHILLEKRPESGIWGGLWSMPELALTHDAQAHVLRNFGDCQSSKALPPFRHTFSHYHLDIHPRELQIGKNPGSIGESDRQIWYDPANPGKLGLASPVKKLLLEHA